MIDMSCHHAFRKKHKKVVQTLINHGVQFSMNLLLDCGHCKFITEIWNSMILYAKIRVALRLWYNQTIELSNRPGGLSWCETMGNLDKLGNKYTCKTIGFTIFIRKWRKPKR